jgi:hypothetical protein
MNRFSFFLYHLFLIIRTNRNISLYTAYLLQIRINNTMSNFDPIFIPISKLNGKECLTHNLLNFTGSIHYTLDGVLICAAEYNGLEEDLEQAFDSFGLGEINRQLIRGVVLTAGVVTVGIINDEEAAAVTTATAAAAAYGFDGNEEVFVGGEGSGAGNDDIDDDEDEDDDDDTVTDLPSSKLQFDSDDESYDEDQQFPQQASFIY